jgi:hypothetical protein
VSLDGDSLWTQGGTLSVLMRSKQGALGSPRRADHPKSICMLSVAIGGRCVAVVRSNLARF